MQVRPELSPPHLVPERRPQELTLQFFELLDAEFKKLLTGAAEPLEHTEDYAALLRVHTHYLTNTVTEQTGQSPCAWINARYLAEAKRLLHETDLSIAAISTQLGFREPTNFSKYFKKHLGLSPKAFREQAPA